jgi:ABC-type uncharacterized transport system permease subunit
VIKIFHIFLVVNILLYLALVVSLVTYVFNSKKVPSFIIRLHYYSRFTLILSCLCSLLVPKATGVEFIWLCTGIEFLSLKIVTHSLLRFVVSFFVTVTLISSSFLAHFLVNNYSDNLMNNQWFFITHVGSAVIGLSSLFICFILGASLFFQDRVLKKKKLYALKIRLPSIGELTTLLIKSSRIGFVALSLTNLGGIIYSISTKGKYSLIEPVQIFSFTAWFVAGLLCSYRTSNVFSPKKRSTIAIFLITLVFLMYLIIYFRGDIIKHADYDNVSKYTYE